MIECMNCKTDLEIYLSSDYLQISFCPACGSKLSDGQKKELYDKTTLAEIDGMIRERLIEMFAWDNTDFNSEALAYNAWESENANGVLFCSNYKGDRFVARHSHWVDDALEYAMDWYGDTDTYVKMKAKCNDAFLVVAFCMATEHYLYHQLDIDINGRNLTKRQVKAIVKKIKDTEYDGGF